MQTKNEPELVTNSTENVGNVVSTSTDTYGKNLGQNTALSIVVLENIEHRYVEVMQELSAEPRFERLRLEYERIYRLLSKSHEGERHLMEKTKELRDELKDHETRISTALELSKEDTQSIAALRKGIEKAWAMADMSHAKEVESRELIQVLMKQVADLDEQVEHSAGLSVGHEVAMRNLLHMKKAREEEHASLVSDAALLKTDHTAYLSRMQVLSGKEAAVRKTFEAETAAYQALLSAMEAEQRERSAKEQSAKNYRNSTEQHVVEVEKVKRAVEQIIADERRLSKDVEAAKESNAVIFRQLEERQQRIKTEADQLAATEKYNGTLKAELLRKTSMMKEKQRELAKVSKRLSSTEVVARDQQNQLSNLVQERDALILRSNDNNEKLDRLLKELAQEEIKIQNVEGLMKGVMLRKTKALAAKSVKENSRVEVEGVRVLEEGKVRRLKQDLFAFLQSNEQLRKQVFELEKKKDKHFSAVQFATVEYHRTLDAIRNKRTELKSLNEHCAMLEKKHKVQQELVNRVKTDRNRAEKQLREMETERGELMAHQLEKQEVIEATKKELIRTETEFLQLHAVNKQLRYDMSNTEERFKHIHDDCVEAKGRVAALETEALELEQVIAKCDSEKQKQLYKLKKVTNDCNILATQLICKNEEVSLIYEKVRLQGSDLASKAADYDKRIDEIIDTRDRLAELRLRCRRSLVQLHYMEKIKKKTIKYQRELNRQRAHVRALTNEVQNFVNIHRWRRLEGSAPVLLDALAQVQLLQRSYIEKSNMCVELTEQIRKKVNEYTKLRSRLTRMPGPEAVEDLALFQENIEKRDDQLQGMVTELQGLEQHAEVLEDEVRTLNDELAEAKKKYYDEKTKQDFYWREALQWRQTWGSSIAVAQLARETIDEAVNFPSKRKRSTPHSAGVESYAKIRTAELASSGPPGQSHHLSAAPQRILSQGGKIGSRVGARIPGGLTQRERAYAREEDLLHILSTGVPGPNFKLQKPKNQRQFAGGGFALTRPDKV
ncbi:unnamed protein product [Phytomonas sp. Hart1]|nr:unnamed protein product [Phytomonas sp. Hart1]|eukprot:CCW69754.1 unnamed protein product [Phytomonas sp. isolate Hart1]